LDKIEKKVDKERDSSMYVRDLTSLTPHIGRIIYFHVIKANINKA
jgi:hypothetical protein